MRSSNGSELGLAVSELAPALEEVLSRRFGTPRRIVRLERHPSSYRSSFNLEELDLWLDDGMTLQMVLKDLSRQSLSEDARRIKPTFLYDPLREIEIYRTILASDPMGSAICYVTFVDPSLDRYWLVLEKVPGLELYQVGDLALWQQAAVWLARFHTRFAQNSWKDDASAAHLLIYDRDYYWLWMRRAKDFMAGARSPGIQRTYGTIDWLSQRFGKVIDRLMTLPRTLIHGEFYASNVLVHKQENNVRVCPIDWEMAALGPGLIDLAALISGNWTDRERIELALTYRRTIQANEGNVATEEEFLASLDCCRLHLAVRWMGWAQDWSPPPEHAHDWLREALCLADRLD